MNRMRLAALAAACLGLACQGPADEPLPNGSADDVELGSVSQAAFSSCPKTTWLAPVRGEDRICTFTYAGRQREYIVHRPPPPPLGVPSTRGVVLEMHGGGGLVVPPTTQVFSGWEQVADTEALASRQSFYVVWPTGRGPAGSADWWTCEYKRPGCPPVAGEANERDFIVAVLNDFKARVTDVNSKRVYAVGLSSGAAMTHMLACDHSDKFAAVAAWAGGVFSRAQPDARYNYDLMPLCNPPRKVPHFYAHALQDTVVPFTEGQASVAFWKGKLGCSSAAASTTSHEYDGPADGNDPSICSRFNCQAGAKLEFCALDASQNWDLLGGHAIWAADDLETPSIFPEDPNPQQRIARITWNFLKDFALP